MDGRGFHLDGVLSKSLGHKWGSLLLESPWNVSPLTECAEWRGQVGESRA